MSASASAVTYRALQVQRLSDDFSGLALCERPVPTVGAQQVLVRVRATALNFPDVLLTQGNYQFKPELPFAPGLEAAGEVVAVGEGVRHVKPGDAVVATGRQGGLAELMLAPAGDVRVMPPGLTWAEGAAYSVAGLTAAVALQERGHLRAGETLVVHGASGGTGLAAVQLGRHMGARVIATGRSLDKLQAARSAGADALVVLGPQLREDLLAATGGRGVDVVFDPIGGDVFDASLRALAWGGRLLVIGFLSERAATVRSNYLLIKGLSVLGVRAGEFARRDPERGEQLRRAVDGWATQGVLRPHISASFALSEAVDALRLMARGGVTGKVVVTP